MAMTAGQFFLYLLIIIILKESLASAESPTSKSAAEEPPSSVRVSTTRAVDTEAPTGCYQLHDYQSLEDLLEVEVGIDEGDDCEPVNLLIRRLVNRLKRTSPSLRIDFRRLYVMAVTKALVV
ncbi:hypothetical protein M758_6G139800 [Ceratodon purpureus]|uniref:Uncharacterized protein n=1 Tax=Ceratodon purpureus TaxID=3225 RepID=A0A8T0HEI6_CERPU|nr:hypothetical protein KC19_6G144800 [Ceratodon purpureus]KAG0613947.1 hypothetical protein M758_6G139800 [Ceratodon purpureus]